MRFEPGTPWYPSRSRFTEDEVEAAVRSYADSGYLGPRR